LHVHLGADYGAVREVAKAGKLASLTIIDNPPFGSEMAQYVKYPIVRNVDGPYDQGPVIYGYGDDRDIETGHKWYWRNDFAASRDTDPRCIIQVANEQAADQDGNFYIGVMLAAEDDKRKVLIFNDPTGWTEFQIATRHLPKAAVTDLRSKPEVVRQMLYERAARMWLGRRAALIHCRDHGHYVGLHVYGNIFGFHPLSAFDNEADFQWWGGRPFKLYAQMPDVWPNLILSEAGAGDCNQQMNQGFDEWKKDFTTFDARTRQYPYLKAFNWWTCGGAFDPVFRGSQIDQWLNRL
jgi:hypothetical protein